MDTGPIVALLDRGDDSHEACADLLRSSSERRVIPAPVLGEVAYWCDRLPEPGVFAAFLDDVRRGAFEIVDLGDADLGRVGEILRTHTGSGPDYVDAAVLAVGERLGEHKLATLDRRHFTLMRPRHAPALELLPEPRTRR